MRRQVAIVPVSEAQAGAAAEAGRRLAAAGLRVSVEDSVSSLGGRVRELRAERCPAIAVIGPREARDGTLSLRLGREDARIMAIDAAARRMAREFAPPS